MSRVRGKSAEPAATTWVFADSLRSPAQCSTRARSRSKSLRPARLGGSATQRAVALPSYPCVTLTFYLLSEPPAASAARPASRRATGTRNGEQDT